MLIIIDDDNIKSSNGETTFHVQAKLGSLRSSPNAYFFTGYRDPPASIRNY